MHIQTVTFTMPHENKENFQKKLQKDQQEAAQSGSLGREVWINESKNEVEFTVVSRWQSKKDFQKWMGREAHLAEHRKMAQFYKEHPEIERPKVEKKLKSYTLYE